MVAWSISLPRGRGQDTSESAGAQAAIADLAVSPKQDKKAIAVDHRLVMSEVQLLLAEKRTSFALLRTGVSIALVPLSIVSLLIATSRLWSVWEIWWLLLPLSVSLLALLIIGAVLIVAALRDVAHDDRVLAGLRASDTLLEDLLIRHGRGDRIFDIRWWRQARDR